MSKKATTLLRGLTITDTGVETELQLQVEQKDQGLVSRL